MTAYSGYISTTIEFEAMDIPTMAESTIGQYKEYILKELFFQDHHGVVRAANGEYPIAATRGQIDALIGILAEWREKAD